MFFIVFLSDMEEFLVVFLKFEFILMVTNVLCVPSCKVRTCFTQKLQVYVVIITGLEGIVSGDMCNICNI